MVRSVILLSIAAACVLWAGACAFAQADEHTASPIITLGNDWCGFQLAQADDEYTLPPVKLKPDRPTTTKPIPPSTDDRATPPEPAPPAETPKAPPAETPKAPPAEIPIAPPAETPKAPPAEIPSVPPAETPKAPVSPPKAIELEPLPPPPPDMLEPLDLPPPAPKVAAPPAPAPKVAAPAAPAEPIAPPAPRAVPRVAPIDLPPAPKVAPPAEPMELPPPPPELMTPIELPPAPKVAAPAAPAPKVVAPAASLELAPPPALKVVAPAASLELAPPPAPKVAAPVAPAPRAPVAAPAATPDLPPLPPMPPELRAAAPPAVVAVPVRPTELQRTLTDAQMEPAVEPDLTGMGEIGLVDEVSRARKAYGRALEALKGYYQSRAAIAKIDWINTEMDAFNKIPRTQYLTVAQLGGPQLRPMRKIEAADQLYKEGMDYKDRPALPPGKKDYLKVAIEKFQTIIEKYPESDKIADAAFRLGEIYGGWYFQDYARAVEGYERCWQWDPKTRNPAIFNAAKIYDEKLKNRVKAVELYNRVMVESTDQDLKNQARDRIRALTGR